MAETHPIPKRQCWECFRRRLVCDFTRPSCKKCIKAGTECPGYNEKKPLKWLTPGKVASKRRGRARSPPHGKSLSTKGDAAPGKNGDKASAEEASNGNLPSTELAIRGAVRKTPDPSTGVEFVPRVNLLDETSDIVRSIHYYNVVVYPETQVIYQMAPNPFLITFPLWALHYLPASIHHTMAGFAIGHRIHQLQLDEDRSQLAKAWTRVYHHRGLAIRELSESICREEKRNTDSTITSVLMVLVTELLLQRSCAQSWRYHADGLLKLIRSRGGFGKLFHSTPHLRAVLTLFLMIGVFGNATSPPSDQFSITSPVLLVSHVTEIYEYVFPHVLCPQSLFIDIITINNIRSQTMLPEFVDDAARSAAEELLERIESFSPVKWAEEKTSFQEEWKLIASIYQSSILLYCILSLQSLAIFTSTPELESKRVIQGDRLFECIRKAVKSVYLKKFLMWPTVILGVEAVYRSTTRQRIVEDQLAAMSRDIGTSTPLEARTMLTAFWASGKKGWDDVFEKPYAFVI